MRGVFAALCLTMACLLVAPGTSAARERAYEDCNSTDPARMISGCTAIISDRTETSANRAAAYVRRGSARLQDGDLDAAIADFDEAINISPQRASANFNRWPSRLGGPTIDIAGGQRVISSSLDGSGTNWSRWRPE